MELHIDTSDIDRKMNRLMSKAPEVFNKMTDRWLVGSANKINTESIKIAKREARGIGGGKGAYMNRFKISRIMGEGMTKRIKIYNTAPYSLVIEYGGTWAGKQPPVEPLAKWVSKVLLGSKGKKKKSKRKTSEKGRKEKKPMTEAMRAKARSSRKSKKIAGNKEAMGIAFAIAKSIKKRGLLFKNSQSGQQGKVLVMNRAVKNSEMFINRFLRTSIEKGLNSL